MGMKVAAVSTLCQDARVFDAMMQAGTPCPIEGKIGKEALALWEQNQDQVPSGSNWKAVVARKEEVTVQTFPYQSNPLGQKVER